MESVTGDRAERRLAAIVAVDVVGYSRLMAHDETGTLDALKAQRRDVITPRMADWRGRLVKLMGDGALMEFGSVVDAVSFAIDVQRTLSGRNAALPEARRLAYRIGVNLGDIIVEGDDIYGDGVNVAARLEPLAPPGGICIAGVVHDQVKRKVEEVFLAQGPRSLKNLPEPVEVWTWAPGGAGPVPDPVAPAAGRPGAGAARPLPLPDKPSIAVLPFANLGADPEQAYFADGVTEDIITGLCNCRWLFVIARNSTFRYRDAATDIRDVGRDLGVCYVLEGSIRRSGSQLRITCQLIDAEQGAHLWAERHDRSLTDIFEVQDEITQGVVAALEPTLKKAEIERVRRKRPDDLGAYDFYLRALQHMYEARPASRAASLAFVARALAIDPHYSEAHGVAAWCHFAQSLWEGSLPEPHREAMLRHAQAVRESQSDDASTLAHAAIALALATRDYETPIAMIERAIASNPSSAHAHGHGSVIHTWAGDHDRAIALSDRALRLSPFDPLGVMPLAGQAGARLMKGDHDGAVAFAKRALLVYPTHTPSFLIMIASLMRLGRAEEARATARRLLEASPGYRIIPTAPVLEHFVAELRAAGLPE